MRHAYLIATLALLLSAAALGPASAQSQGMPANGTLDVAGPLDGLTPGSAAIARAQFEYTTDSLSPRLATGGIEVHYRVVDAPSWATVVVSPSSDILYTDGGLASTSYHAATTFRIQVMVSEDAPVNAPGEIRVEAIAEATAFTEEAAASASFPVWRADAIEACHHAETEAVEEPAELTVQGAASSTVVTPGALGAAGLAAVGVIGAGIALRRRFL